MVEAMSDGVLHTPSGGRWRLRRFDPPPDLADLVGCGWSTEWQLPPGSEHLQAVLPHPCANLVVEDGRATFHGPARGRFDRPLEGAGRVIGVRMRPGVVRLLTGRRAATTVDAVIDGGELGHREGLAAAVAGVDDGPAAVEMLFDAVRAVHADAVDVVGIPREVRDLTERIQHDDAIRTLDDVATVASRSARTLQRLFADHVGLTPAWVIRRYRLHRALGSAQAVRQPDWAAIAARVGYYDQPHLVRDFTAVVGQPPARYHAATEMR